MGELVILDRDGVLNELVIDPEHGTIDSPLHPDQVRLLPGVAVALARLKRLGFTVAVATNQPAAAKGKATRALLEATHERVMALAQGEGGTIADSYICWHRSGEGCRCRKPAIGLLEAAWQRHSGTRKDLAWMVGDGVTDVEAGMRFGCSTAFLGPRKCDHCKIFESRSLEPTAWMASFPEWVDWLASRGAAG